MAKKTKAQLDAEEAIRLLEKEAELRARMNSSYDDYIKAVKEAHALQQTLVKNKEIEKEIEEKVKAAKAGTIKLTKEELAVEEEKLKIIQAQNEKIAKQVELYKSAAKEVNAGAMAAGKALNKLGAAAYKNFVDLPNMVEKAWGKLKSLGLFELDKAIKQSAFDMGVLSKEGVGFRNNLKSAADVTTRMGVDIKGLAELQASYSNNLGRTVTLTKDGAIGMAEMSKLTGLGAEGAAQMAADMDLQGYSAERTAGFVEETLNASHRMGVNATKVMKNLSGNLKLMNKYHFKEGAKGLAKMAQLVTKLGVDMNSVSGMADKLWNIEGAVEMSAQLNVMGGAWAAMSDPFHLMYMARNDMAGLTEEIAKASQESIKFNDKTGEFDMSAEGMHRLKIIAEQTGMAYEDLVTMGKNMAKFDKIKTQVGFSVGGSEEDKALLDYISSKSTLNKKGEGTIMVNGSPKLLTQLTASDKNIIKAQMDQKETMKERIEQSQSFDEQLTYFIADLKLALLPMIEAFNKEGGIGERLRQFGEDFNKPGGWKDTIKYWAGKIGDLISSVGGWILENPKLTASIWALTKAAPLIVGAFKLFGGVWDTIKWFKNGIALGNGFNSVASAGGGGGGFGGGGGGGNFLSNMMRGGAKGGFGRNMLAGVTKLGRKGGFGLGGKMNLATSLGKGAKAFSGLGALGLAADVGRGFMDDPNSTGGKLLGVGGTAASWAGTGALLGSVIPGVGNVVGGVVGGLLGAGKGIYDEWFGENAADAAEDAYFGSPVRDAIFNRKVNDGLFSGSLEKSLMASMIPAIGPAIGAAMTLNDVMSTRGVVQGGKITPIDNKDDVVALKKGGAIDKFANSSSGGGSTTVKHVFEPITINGKITLESPGGKTEVNLLEDQSFRRAITRVIQEETVKQRNQGKPKG